jgi:hypothetical protein
MLVFISRAMAFKFIFEVYTGYHFGFIIALCKNNTYMLVVFLCISFQRISRAWSSAGFAFIIIDIAVLHNILYFFLRNMTALHPAFGMLCIFQVTYPPVEPPVAIGIIAAVIAGGGSGLFGSTAATPAQHQRSQYQYGQQEIGGKFFHCRLFLNSRQPAVGSSRYS